MLIQDQFGIIQNLKMSPIPETSFLVGTFFAVSYSKPALSTYYGMTSDEISRENIAGILK